MDDDGQQTWDDEQQWRRIMFLEQCGQTALEENETVARMIA
jgi:hypothetical protein